MKKVLIVTYYWPPAGGPGVQRVLKFAKYLPQFGWEPIILTVDNGNYPALDEALEKDIPQSLKVYKTKTLEPFVMYNRLRGKSADANIDTFAISKTNKSLLEQFSTLIRQLFFIPDARKGWKRYAVKAGLEIIKKENIDVIFSSSPPHSLQLAAKAIAKRSKCPWVADFRDPWSKAFWLDSDNEDYFFRKNKKKEASVFNTLDHITTVSQGFMDGYLDSYPSVKNISSQIHNGFDDADFKGVERRGNKVFTIRYIGTLAKSQNPIFFFEALVELSNINFKVEFWGKFDSSIVESVTTLNLQDKVSFHPYVSHQGAVELMINSDMLLLVIPFENSKGILTGKMYEYIASQNPIIGVGPLDSEASSVITSNKVGQYFASKEGLSTYIDESINLWKNGSDIAADIDDVSIFSRKSATEQLSKIFNKLID